MVSIYVTVFTLLFSFPLGVLLALARTSRLPIFRLLATIYIESFRGVPLITMLFFFTVFVNLFLPEGMELALWPPSRSRSCCSRRRTSPRTSVAVSRRCGGGSTKRAMRLASPRCSAPVSSCCHRAYGCRSRCRRQAIATYKETSLLAIVGVFDFFDGATSSRTSRNSSVSASRAPVHLCRLLRRRLRHVQVLPAPREESRRR